MPGVAAPAPRANLTLVPAARRRPSRTPFVLLVVGLLASGLIGLLMLNTSMSQESFQLTDLQKQTASLTDQEQALQREINELQTPQNLADAASALGMRPSQQPLFLLSPGGSSASSSGGSR